MNWKSRDNVIKALALSYHQCNSDLSMVTPSHFLHFSQCIPELLWELKWFSYHNYCNVLSVFTKKTKMKSADPIIIIQYFATKVINNLGGKKKRKSKKLGLDFFFLIFSLSKLPLEGKSGICWDQPNMASQSRVGFKGWIGVLKAKKKGSVIFREWQIWCG